MSTAALLFFAMILDAIFGEPKWLWHRAPHPAVLMGNLIKWCDEQYNSGKNAKLNGVLTLLALVTGAALLGYIISLFGGIVTILVTAILLAQKSLVQHVQQVADALRLSLDEGRQKVAMIVGRDTAQMDQPAVARGAIESAAENLSDGVIAPAFWFLVGGLPGLMVYKIVNTADSMIGYKTERHADFGWASARFDDLLNLIPARITAALIALPAGVHGQWRDIIADAKLHRSPNAGWPEAAMARAIDIALSGPRAYEGQMQDFPFVHTTGNQFAGPSSIDAACSMLWKAWGIALLFTIILTIL
ncbi:adenosylcobinamide-phosphate synthase CbiB [Ascidiaceihabitans sp.]|nr:adenosylcobinamide-phosphate synthase CbiB [Ascidiaceihabitans sp.]